MVMHCVAYGCNNKHKTYDRTYSFHRFPHSRPELLSKWVIAIRRKNWKPTKYSRLCSKHFTEDCYQYRRGTEAKLLKEDAVPSIFDFPSHVRKKQNSRRILVRPSLVSSTSTFVSRIAKRERIFTTKKNVMSKKEYKSSNDDFSEFKIQNNGVELTENENCQNMSSNKRKNQFKNRRILENENSSQVKRIKQEKFDSLSAFLIDLREKNLLSYKAYCILSDNFSDSTLRVLNNLQNKKNQEYSKEIKKFAKTLYYYSPKSYEYVRKNIHLPEVTTVSRWFVSTDGKPGFSKVILDAISEKAKNINGNIYATLMFDDMTMKKKVDWDDGEFIGYVNLSEDVIFGESAEAKEVTVFKIVGINIEWKIPIAYFFTKEITIIEKCNLINLCLTLMNEIGVTVVGITCDCIKSNFSMAEKLGAKLRIDNISPWFPHPTTKQDVCILFDSCCLLKRLRNFFAESKLLIDYENREIKWELIEKLQLLLSSTELLDNRIKPCIMKFHYEKCQVAAQALNSSVGKNLLVLENDLSHQDFKETAPTADFIFLIEGLIDLCNSKNPLSRDLKSPLKMSNKHLWQPFLTKVIAYLLDLRNSDKKLVRNTNKGTAVIGFVSLIVSLEHIFDSLIETNEMKYLLTYKFSLDHLHMYFCKICKYISSNNNLTAFEFKKAFKFLEEEELKYLSTDYTVLHKTAVLERKLISVSDENKNLFIFDPVTFSECRKLGIDYINNKVINRRYLLRSLDFCEYLYNIFIRDVLVKNVCEIIICRDCCACIVNKNFILNNSPERKQNNDKLLYPSSDVLKICKQTEKVIKEMLGSNRRISFKNCLMVERQVLRYLSIDRLFVELTPHVVDNIFPENHIYNLIKAIIQQYIKISCYDDAVHDFKKFAVPVHKKINEIL